MVISLPVIAWRIKFEPRDHRRVHARSVGIEDAHDTDVDFVHAIVVHEQGLGGSFAFVVASPWSNRVNVATITFGLRMHLGVTIDLGGTGSRILAPQRLAIPSILIEP